MGGSRWPYFCSPLCSVPDLASLRGFQFGHSLDLYPGVFAHLAGSFFAHFRDVCPRVLQLQQARVEQWYAVYLAKLATFSSICLCDASRGVAYYLSCCFFCFAIFRFRARGRICFLIFGIKGCNFCFNSWFVSRQLLLCAFYQSPVVLNVSTIFSYIAFRYTGCKLWHGIRAYSLSGGGRENFVITYRNHVK